jgi:hypothetical protein
MRSHVLALALAITGCATGQQSKGERLLNDVRAFHEGLRWRRFDEAADHIPPPTREQFLDGREALDDDLRIDDYEIERTKMPEDKVAKVQIRYTWHLESRGTVYTTVVEQRWEQVGKGWILFAEERKRGEPMPEPPPPSATRPDATTMQ